jgi:putative transposase
VTFINDHRARWGVEPICRVLTVAPFTYYAARARPLSARACRDAELKVEILRVYEANFSVYGAKKVWRQLGREGTRVGRDRVARLMAELGIAGVVRGKAKRTTTPPVSVPARLTWSTASSPLASPTGCG